MLDANTLNKRRSSPRTNNPSQSIPSIVLRHSAKCSEAYIRILYIGRNSWRPHTCNMA
ncbi:hypothetical protein B7P43_G03587 [Cryptotermes secundus]|uniref:Uncharacterized protein n=1 Tax=Cryptotermes secundus TaxID=105785 RepID=A0A2J7PCG9_9NEOP|nr:hypothetical protein B7P43_G03587 [Cryptotermes secundus]